MGFTTGKSLGFKNLTSPSWHLRLRALPFDYPAIIQATTSFIFSFQQSDLVIEAEKQDTHTYTKTLVSFHTRKYRTFPTSPQARSTLKWIRV
jgi:hypothetical protein